MTTVSKKITEAERAELAEKLDKDLDSFLDSLEKRPYTEGWPEDRWQEEMEKHPFFMKKPPEPGEELDPLMEGLQLLKYDPNENTPEELALAYKDDGNFNFKYKNYRIAIIAYTEAIKQKCDNVEVNATLHNNRSAANYFLKNYRSCLRDCEIALKLKPVYDKVLLRAANCYFHVGQFEKGVEFCDTLLEKEPENKEVLKLRQACVNSAKAKERDERRKERTEEQNKWNDEMLFEEIRKRGVKFEEGDNTELEYAGPQYLDTTQFKVGLDISGNLVWPVFFVYPEYQIMDVIQYFNETDRFIHHLNQVFEEPPPWDKEKKYHPQNVNIYFTNYKKCKVYAVTINDILADILRLPDFIIKGGAPTFYICAKGSLAERSFLNGYY